LLAYFLAVVGLVIGMVAMSFILGQRHMAPATGQPYESGMVPTGLARRSWDIQFYMVAMFFVVFDLESVFIFAWAVAVRPLGWAGYAWVAVFILTLLVILIYLWRQGTLDWGSRQEILANKTMKDGTRDAGLV
jgi:NADH-quinone oxidoreductase subunit A